MMMQLRMRTTALDDNYNDDGACDGADDDDDAGDADFDDDGDDCVDANYDANYYGTDGANDDTVLEIRMVMLINLGERYLSWQQSCYIRVHDCNHGGDAG